MKTRLSFVALLAVGVGAGALVQLRAAEPQESAVSQADESPADETAPKRPAKAPAREVDPDAPGVDPEKIDWSKVNWRRRLTREQFRILRQAGTERAFTGDLWDVFEPGRY
ncbi:MAG TPA: peptide-methionine (R)-S-oxide reductase, partial [Lacipirellulaceae bacterium]|nr:peptide-methionine (R)-S-oxide reductase [Lacipirellulaceae bacterium]